MRDDDGFTLIELLIAVTMLGVIIGAVSTGLIVMFTTTEETTQRLSESPDLQIAAAYFGSDIQSATSLTISCSSSTVLVLTWTDPGSTAAAGPATGDTTRTITYSVPLVGNQKQLVRAASIDGGAADTTTLVNFLRPMSTPCPTQAGTPTSVNLALEVCTADAANVCKNLPLSFELKATRRTT